MENNNRYLESCGAGERSGLYYTCVNSYLTAEELAYILNNSESKVLITSRAKREVALQALKAVPEDQAVPGRSTAAIDDGAVRRFRDRGRRLSRHADRRRSARARRCSTPPAPPAGPKGILRPLPREPAVRAAAAVPLPAQAVALPRGHDLPVAGAALPLGAAGRGRRSRSATAARRSSWSASIPSSTWRWSRSTRSRTASSCRPCSAACSSCRRGARALRPVVAGDRRPRRRALPGAGEGADDRMVGPDHPRVLRRHRGPRLHRLRQRGMARAPGHRRQGAARRPAHPRRRHAALSARARPARSGSRPRRRSSTSTTRRRPRRRARPTAR